MRWSKPPSAGFETIEYGWVVGPILKGHEPKPVGLAILTQSVEDLRLADHRQGESRPEDQRGLEAVQRAPVVPPLPEHVRATGHESSIVGIADQGGIIGLERLVEAPAHAQAVRVPPTRIRMVRRVEEDSAKGSRRRMPSLQLGVRQSQHIVGRTRGRL